MMNCFREGSHRGSRPDLPQLTSRQIEVLRLMMQGLPQKKIAKQLGISVQTVKGHAGNMRARMTADTTIGMILLAIDAGLVATDNGYAYDI